MTFKHEPTRPIKDEAYKAYLILVNARKVAGSFFSLFETLRDNRGAGTYTDQEQDLLRAMVAFASAGLDAMVKQLIRDTLPKVAHNIDGSHVSFEGYIERRLKKDPDKSIQFIAKIIADKNPRARLVKEWIEDLTADSMQSVEQLSKAAASFDIPTATLTNDLNKIKKIFTMRNEIVHEMDIDFSRNNRSRRSRKKTEMKEATEELFDIANRFLKAVDQKI